MATLMLPRSLEAYRMTKALSKTPARIFPRKWPKWTTSLAMPKSRATPGLKEKEWPEPRRCQMQR